MNAPPLSAKQPAVGFTLLELLVAVSIVALLAGIAVPVTQRIMHRSKATHCMGNLRGLGTALQLYLGDNNNILPTLVIGRPDKETDEAAIDNTLNEYTDGQAVFCCKADNKGLFERTGTSYHWNHLVNGQNVASMDFMGFVKDSSRIPMMGDKENFHKFRDVEVNILYADGHVAKEISFTVNGE